MGSREAMRFSELKRSLAGISGTVLSERLLEIERQGLITKKILEQCLKGLNTALPQARKSLKM
jgi:DNA-binding HxlR family transcriptional regulator